MKVFIVGSCVSRDALATAGGPGDIRLAGYYARSSLGVLPSAPVTLPDEVVNIAAPWCRRMVQTDHAKTLLRAVTEASFDLLLLDLIDERFNLLETPGGGVVTMSQEYADAFGGRQVGHVLPAYGARHVALWREGFAMLTALLREQGRLDRLRVNRVFWANQTIAGVAVAGFKPARIAAANAFLRARYDDIARVMGDTVFLDYSADAMRADPAHRWGLSPFHFAPEFYTAQLVALRAAHSAAPTPDGTMAGDPLAGASHCDPCVWRRPVFGYPPGARWPQRHSIGEGIHRFALPADHTLDLLLEGLGRLREANTLLVCFGTTLGRAERTAPFSFGQGIGEALGRPVLCVRDPVVAHSPTLALGWYAGYRGCTDLPLRIAELLDDLAARLAVRLVLFGGSGDGFGALAVLSQLRSPASALVWNPQTTIERYYPDWVRDYLDAAFREEPRVVAGGLKSRLDASGIQHSLLDCPPRFTHPRLFLQNRRDTHHVEQHARAYAAAARALRVSQAVFAGDGESAFWFGDWGGGHVPPPSEVLRLAIDRLSAGASALAVALELDAGARDAEPFDL